MEMDKTWRKLFASADCHQSKISRRLHLTQSMGGGCVSRLFWNGFEVVSEELLHYAAKLFTP